MTSVNLENDSGVRQSNDQSKEKKHKIRVQVRSVKSDEVKGPTDKEVVPGTRCDDKYTCPNFLYCGDR
jgi:hypothetical protein